MSVKIRASTFIDALQLELNVTQGNFLRAVLRDDKGSICSTLEKDVILEQEKFTWVGLDHLPYGQYTLELSQGTEELTMNLVKRV